MRSRKHERFTVALAVAVVTGLTTATGSLAVTPSTACPERARTTCQEIGPRLGLEGTQRQRPLIRPRADTDARGQQVWRAGSHLMY